MKKFICSFVSAFLVFMSFPAVYADNPTYFELKAGETLKITTNQYGWNIKPDQDVRIVFLHTTASSPGYIWVVSTSSFSIYMEDGLSTTTVQSTSHSNYYTYNFTSVTSNNLNPVIPDIVDTNKSSTAYDYTYGSKKVDPVPPEPPAPVFGDLTNVGYNTRIAGSGQASINNLDTVSWNPETDTSGNDISDMLVSVRVVPGKYSASSRQNLYEKLYTDFVLNDLGATVLDTVTVSSGSFSVTWEDVIDTLALPFATVASIVDQDGTFIKNGWIYQVRLEGDNYTGEWQTVYTATSSGVENDLTIVQSTTINQTLVNTITEINQLNETNNNWYINETTINMSDYTEPSEGNKPWWAYLLEAIVSLINKLIDGISSIIGAIADLVGDIIDGILGLFTFDSFSVPDFSTHQQNIHDNSGIFGESIDILQTMNQTISNADSSAEPILYYPGIDLEGVEFIPEITINLNDYVEDLGLTQWHNLAYTCTDIFIWTTLIYTIYRKLIGVFKK